MPVTDDEIFAVLGVLHRTRQGIAMNDNAGGEADDEGAEA
jgi:hypothetical protein